MNGVCGIFQQNLPSFARDAFHRLVSVGAGNAPVCAYTLNAKDQRTSSSLPGVPDESFGYLYDDSGNRTSSTEGGVTRAYTANNLNQYTAITNPAVSPAYDGDGAVRRGAVRFRPGASARS